MKERDLETKVAEVARELYKKGLVSAYGGSVSMRAGGKIYVTPSYYPITETSLTCFGDAEPKDIIVVDLTGKKIKGERNPSFETKAHLSIYNDDPEVGGIVHTHQPYALAWGMALGDLVCWTDAPRSHIGKAILVEQRPAGSEWLAANVAEGLRGRHAIIARNHGIWCKGKYLNEALHIAYQLEEAAKTQVLAALMRTEMFKVAAAQLEKEAEFLDNMFEEEKRIKKRMFDIDFKYPETK